MSTVSIRTKLWIAFSTALLMVVAIGLFGLAQLRAVNHVAQEGREIWLPRVEQAAEMKRQLTEHWALATRRSQTTNFHHLAGIDFEMREAMTGLRASAANFPNKGATPEETRLLDEFRKLCREYQSVLRTAFHEIDRGEVGGGQLLLKTAANQTVEKALGTLTTLVENSKAQMRQSAERADTAYSDARLLTIIFLIVAANYAALAVVWTSAKITAPLGRISDAMKRLAAGDASITMRKDEQRQDEIGVLADAVAGYRASLIRSQQFAETAERDRARLQAAVNNMPVGLAMFDKNQRLIICNKRYGDIYELPDGMQRPGTSLEDIIASWVGVAPDADNSVNQYFARIARESPDAQTQQIVKLRNGRIVNIIRQGLGDGGWVATHEDVTERRRIEERIHHMARHDALTDLPNRVNFTACLTDELHAIERGGSLALLCLDLDRFKSVNDTLGHPSGDVLLKQVAERLRAATRDTDVVARFGGDEFSIIQSKCEQPTSATALAERLIEVLSAPYDVHGNQVVIGVSVGIAIAPSDGTGADVLLKHGDMALYRAKADGRGTYRLFEQEMDARMHARRALEVDMRQALERDQFEVHYQPLIDLASGNLSGFEALVRWRHPTRGMVSPGEFVPLAEDIGLIVPIGALVLRKACLAAAAWPEDIKVTVNISPVQFQNRKIITEVSRALAEAALAPHRLELEITEGVLLQDAEATLSMLHQLRAMGVRIAMDDFGTGYSSLSYLRSFPFDKIKIDRSFISHIANDDGAVAIIRAITSLAAGLGMATTAEGVETAEQLMHVRNAGCSEAQGYLFSPARPESEIPELLRRLRRQQAAA